MSDLYPLPEGNFDILVPPPSEDNERSYKDVKHRLTAFAAWLSDTGRSWEKPDLWEYRQHLLEERGLAPLTVKVHLSTIRVRYRALLEEITIRTALERTLPSHLTAAQRENSVKDLIRHIREEVDPQATQLEVEPSDINYVRLTEEDVKQLLSLPDASTLLGLRDKAIIALLVSTGLRASELCALDVSDLYHELEEEAALKVRPGTGCTERLVPYGIMPWGLYHVDAWRREAHINSGAVFRSFYKGGKPRETRLTTRALDKVLAGYPLERDGDVVIIRPMDLRRTYACLLYDAGVNLGDIKTNLGLKDVASVRNYIGYVHRPH